ncbi:MAG: hypothetical protein ACTSRG_04445 [Candidatus Helarchaeota archaeon]
MSNQRGGSIGEETRDLVVSPSILFGAVGKENKKKSKKMILKWKT